MGVTSAADKPVVGGSDGLGGCICGHSSSGGEGRWNLERRRRIGALVGNVRFVRIDWKKEANAAYDEVEHNIIFDNQQRTKHNKHKQNGTNMCTNRLRNLHDEPHRLLL